jgi:hypothetical protein
VGQPETHDSRMWTILILSRNRQNTLWQRCTFPTRLVDPDDYRVPIARDRPQAIVVDVATLQDWNTVAGLRTSFVTAAVPVVVIVEGGAQERLFRRCARELGCSGVLVRPCLPEEFILVIENVVFATLGQSRWDTGIL